MSPSFGPPSVLIRFSVRPRCDAKAVGPTAFRCLTFLGFLILAGSTDGLSAEPSRVEPPTTKISPTYDLTYNEVDGDAGKCDVFLPADDGGASLRPAVLVIHGGGWMSGDKWTMAAYGQKLARAGYVAISINYRLAPTHKFPAQVDDVRQALLWIRGRAEKYRIDLERLGLFGYSAGGHLSALTALLADEPVDRQTAASDWPVDDPRWKDLPKIKTVCVGGPPCDFRLLPPGNTSLAYFLGGSRSELPEIYEAASPTAQVSPDDPPIQIVHGIDDLLVPISGSRGLQKAMIGAGVLCELKELPGRGHMLTFLDDRTNQTMLQWFGRQL